MIWPLDRINRGAEFIEPKYLPIKEEYFNWLMPRASTAIRLLDSVCELCVNEIPKSLSQTKSEDDLRPLLNQINTFVSLYDHTKKFEKECRQVIPPESLETIHELTYGWTDPIREGVRNFTKILDDLSNISAKALKSGKVSPPSFCVKFAVPENLQKFNSLHKLAE